MPIRCHEGAPEEMREDLDFSIPTAPGSTRSDRSRAIAPVKEVIAALPTRIRGLEALTALEAPRGSVAAGRGHSRLLRHRPRGACRGGACRAVTPAGSLFKAPTEIASAVPDAPAAGIAPDACCGGPAAEADSPETQFVQESAVLPLAKREDHPNVTQLARDPAHQPCNLSETRGGPRSGDNPRRAERGGRAWRRNRGLLSESRSWGSASPSPPPPRRPSRLPATCAEGTTAEGADPAPGCRVGLWRVGSW